MSDNFMQMSSGRCCDYQWESKQSTRKFSSQQETNSNDSKASRDFIAGSAMNALQSEWGKCLAFGKTPALTTASLTFLSFLLLYSDGDDGIEKRWEIGLAACFPQITPISWQQERRLMHTAITLCYKPRSVNLLYCYVKRQNAVYHSFFI